MRTSAESNNNPGGGAEWQGSPGSRYVKPLAFVENVRANPAEHSKAGWDKRRMLGQTITLSFLATMIIAYTAGGERTREAVTPTLFTFGPLFILFALVALWESFPLKSPKSAIRQFYYCINRCRWDRGSQLVSPVYCRSARPRRSEDSRPATN